MKCCVSSCANNGNAPPSADVFYFQIPKEFDLRQLWTKAIGTSESELQPNSVVCSAHFGEFEFVISETGDKKLIYGAVPSLHLNIVEDLQAQAEFKTCRVCLAMDRKMFNIRDHNLHHLYKMIVGVTVEARDGLPQMMCWECTSKLLSLKKFKEQAQTSQLLLSDKLAVDNILTVGDIKSIDRAHYNLKSSLTMKHYEPNEFDFNIEVFELNMKPMEMLLDIKSERDQEPTLEIDGFSPTCKIPKCTKVEPESNNLVKLMMLDLKQNIDVMDTSQPYIIDELHSDISQQAEHRDSKVNTKPTRQRVKPIPAAERTSRKRDLNVQKKGNSAAKVNPFGKMELPCFEIRDLTLEEQQAAMEARARSSAYLTAPYKCDDCYKAFLSERTLARHAVRHTETFGPYGCAVCKCRFRRERQMRHHIKMRHANKYTCRDCGMVTQDRDAAISHQKEHNGTNIYQCPHCPVTFRKRTSLLGHLRVKHSSRFACELCGYTFLNQHGVNTHKRKSHSLEAQVKLEGPYCEECKLRFASDEAYQRHLTQSSVHSSDHNPNRVRNELCATYKVQQRKTLKRPGKPIPCEECGEQQVNYTAYGKHFRAAHPDLVRTKFPRATGACMCLCEQCGKRFPCAALLREHMAWHEGVKRHRCDVCDKVLSNKYLLRMHRVKHGSQPPPTYPCPHCERTYSCPTNRDRHVKTVHQRKRFECKICGKEVTTMASMRDHIDHVHHKKPWPKRVRAPRSRSRPSTDCE